MGLMKWLWEEHQLLMHQCFSIPFAFLFYFLAKRRFLPLTYRYLFLCAGGCVLAVLTMGVYSAVLFTPAFLFLLLVSSVAPGRVHGWAFGAQMLWQTSWHLLIQYREHYLHEPVSTSLFLAASSSMLLTQRITSVSLDLQERRLELSSPALLPLLSYTLNFTTLLGGPLCSYGRFVSLMTGTSLGPPPSPLCAVPLQLVQVLFLQCVRHCLVYYLKRTTRSLLWAWGLAVALRVQYYSHWRISECLNYAAGLGLWETPSGGWSGLSDGDFWTTEASSRMSEFSRRWNGTTASWLRRLVYLRSGRFPLLATFGFSLWWHGGHVGHFVGFLTWAATVKADHHIHRHLCPGRSSTWRKAYACLSWINTQMIISCVVIAVELRNASGLRLLSTTYIGLFPLLNVILLIIPLKVNAAD